MKVLRVMSQYDKKHQDELPRSTTSFALQVLLLQRRRVDGGSVTIGLHKEGCKHNIILSLHNTLLSTPQRRPGSTS